MMMEMMLRPNTEDIPMVKGEGRRGQGRRVATSITCECGRELSHPPALPPFPFLVERNMRVHLLLLLLSPILALLFFHCWLCTPALWFVP